MIDTSFIALDDYIEQNTPTRLGKASGNGVKRTRKGPCPWCGGTDRFAVLVADSPQHFYCGIHGGQGCGRHGDAIAFVQQWHNIDFMQAIRKLGVEMPERPEGYLYDLGGGDYKKKPAPVKIDIDIDAPPSTVWAMAALSFSQLCQHILLNTEQGKPALAWLMKRGLTLATIKERGYGYNHTEQFVEKEEWDVHEGKKVWLPRGITIPWMIGGTIWKISIRRGDKDVQADASKGKKPIKYVVVKGGSNGLYRADTIKSGQPLIIFEGEFNADILGQVLAEAGITDVSIVATGSTGKGRSDNWLTKIAKASPILFSFDPDGAGGKALKEYWLKVLPDALVWQSVDGDLNDMFLAGKDVVKWLQKGLRLATNAPVKLVPPLTYRTAARGPYIDAEGRTTRFTVVYLSEYADFVAEEMRAFEADMDVLEFDWHATADETSPIIAKFRKWHMVDDLQLLAEWKEANAERSA